MKKINFKKKNTAGIIAICIAGVLVVGALIGLFSSANSGNKKVVDVNPSWSVGALTTQGKYKEAENSIYTKEAFDCYGLNVTLAFENDIAYQIYFYDFDGAYLSSTQSLTTNYKEVVPESAKTCRIVITPLNDDSISFFEVNGYARQLSIEVSTKQFDSLDKKQDYLSDTTTVGGDGSTNPNDPTVPVGEDA